MLFRSHNIYAKNLRLKPSGANYGSKLNFGDGEYVYLHEDTDDHLSIYAKNGIKINSDMTIKSSIQLGDYDTERIEVNDRKLVLKGYKGISIQSYIESSVCPTAANKYQWTSSFCCDVWY